MAKTPKKPKPEEEVETHPDGWERFQDTMDKIVHRSIGHLFPIYVPVIHASLRQGVQLQAPILIAGADPAVSEVAIY